MEQNRRGRKKSMIVRVDSLKETEAEGIAHISTLPAPPDPDNVVAIPSLPPAAKVAKEHEEIRSHFRNAIEELKPSNDGEDNTT